MVGIIINTTVYGTHCWPGVVNVPELKAVHFLKDEHLHNFHIKCKKVVSHADRDVEIINLKMEIDKWIRVFYYNPGLGYCQFGQKSCEMLATKLAEVFDLTYVEVLEDGNFGGFYQAD